MIKDNYEFSVVLLAFLTFTTPLAKVQRKNKMYYKFVHIVEEVT